MLLPVESLLPRAHGVTLDGENAGRFLSGLRRRGDWPDNGDVGRLWRKVKPHALIGTAHIVGGELIPGR